MTDQIYLINEAPGIPGTQLGENVGQGADKLKALFPQTDWTVQLDYGESVGLGSREYDLIEVTEA